MTAGSENVEQFLKYFTGLMLAVENSFMSVKKQAKVEDRSGAPGLGWDSVLCTEAGCHSSTAASHLHSTQVEGPAGMGATSHCLQTGHVTIKRKDSSSS